MNKNNQHLVKGKEGESIAKKYLQENGFLILGFNKKISYAEIDIIARKENVIHFIEVKTRKNTDYGNPETFVNKKKQKLLINAANIYLQEIDDDVEAKFDIISIVLNDKGHQLDFIEEAFYPIL